MHVRQQIREAIQDALLGDSSVVNFVDDRVYRSRVYPDGTFPCIGIYTLGESLEAFQGDGVTTGSETAYNRFLDVAIEIKAEKPANQDVDDYCDDLVAAVESVLADTFLGGLVVELPLTRIDPPRLEASAKPLMVVRLVHRAWYRTTAAIPTAAI